MLKKSALFLFFVTSLFSEGKRSFIYYGGYPKEAKFEHIYRPSKPIMWSARLKVDRAYFFGKQMPLWNFKERLDVVYGVSIGYLEKHIDYVDKCLVFSTFLGLQLDIKILKSLHAIVFYSPAGPSFLTKRKFATTSFSNNFVFTDQFGIGLKINRENSIEMGFRMYHFSNAEIFPINGGIDVPIMFYIGVYG